MTARRCSATCRCRRCDPDRARDEQVALVRDREADGGARVDVEDEPYTGPIGGPGEWMAYSQ